MRAPLQALLLGCLLLTAGPLMNTASAQDVWDQVEHRYADSNGVKIHYAVLGEGPLVVMIHGFPDFWYTWRHQMRALADHKYRVAAVDLRGYNLSDKPKGIESYSVPLLVGDIAAVVKAEKQSDAIIVGHDWGGVVAWNVAMTKPELTRLLIICNLPHPAGISREIATNPQQKKNSEYAFNFQKPDAHKTLTAERLAGWVRDPAAKARYVEAFSKSDFESMLNYYKANYPKRGCAAAGRGRAVPEGQGAGADVPRPGRPGAVARRAQRHVAVGRQGSDDHDGSRLGSLRAAGRGADRERHDGGLAGAAAEVAARGGCP